MRRLSVVIVNWNTQDLLSDCLASVMLEVTSFAVEVIVVDNNSSDGSQQMVKDLYPQVKLVENKENVGFARANNQAFPLCTGDFVLLLNSDTRVLGNTLQTMVDFMESHPEAGAIGPKIIHPAMRLRVLSCGYLPTTRTMFSQFFGLNSLFPEVASCRGLNLIIGKHDDRVRPVEWISGACLLVRNSVIEQVGGLSTQWFMFAEDMEWCERIGRHGWRLYSVPDAVIVHYFGASTEKNKAVSTLWITSLRDFFVLRSKPSAINILLFDAVLVVGLGVRALFYGLRSVVDQKHGRMWRQEAVRFAAYSKAVWAAMWS